MAQLEKHFQAWIVKRARHHNWRVYHCPTPMRPTSGGKWVPDGRGSGLPDLIMLHDSPPRMILAEIKSATGIVSDKQEAFLRIARMVARVGIPDLTGPDDDIEQRDPLRPLMVFTWRPGVEPMIEAVLAGTPA